ncbi:MAG TPA: RHS repeat-associated core domain-containing protein [Spongiibacteraceae bacterium]|nr:RHS repeat-associated core domain-containing protein [Spongiibacteraceae bacterium]
MAAIASLNISIHRQLIRRFFAATLAVNCGILSSLAIANNPTLITALPVSTAAQALLRNAPVFEEPLLPSKATSIGEDQALVAAVASYRRQSNVDDFKVFEDFLKRYPQSGWRMALSTNLGLANYHYGYFSRAIAGWEDAWSQGRDITEPAAKALVDRAIGELVRMHARLGHTDRLAALMDEIGDRPVTGQATEALTGAREGLWTMRNDPGVAYLCGPKALKNLMLSEKKSTSQTEFLDSYRSSPQGVSLAEVGKLAKQGKQPYVLAFREGDAPIPLPALVHWKVSHFATIVAQENGRYHVKDPTFGTDIWISQGALDSEASGYFLLPSTKLADGFRSVSLAEASRVRGRGTTSNNDPWPTSPDDEKGHPPCSNPGMCGANFHSMVLSLNLVDTPVGYAPPKGPSVFVTLTYNQREANQPATFNFSNVSPKWTMNWLSYIQDDPTSAGANVLRYVAGGGSLNYAGYNSATGKFTPEGKNAAVLQRIAGTPVAYRRTLGDGSVEIYAQPDGATTYPRRIFLTQKIDPTGNAVTLAYDVTRRLTSITDALGQVTNFTYGVSGQPLLISAVTDPFGRSAQMTYDASNRLSQITDAVGLTSKFTYDTSGLVNSLTTPYGTTNFAFAGTGVSRWLEITDPLGFTERAEFRHTAPGIPYSEAKVPVGINPFNQYVDSRNTFHWDKSLYSTTHTDYTKADIKHWLHDAATGLTAPVLESIKHPLESRIWFNYPGQSSPWLYTGTLNKPGAEGRVMDNNATQLTKTTYNSLGNPTSVIDPVGNQTFYDYDTNQIDVLRVRQKTGASTDITLAQYTYNALHLPLTYTDANGQVTTYTYNAAGQRLTSTDALGHATTYNYNASGYLTSIVDANGNAAVTFTYDAAGRIATRADAVGNVLSYQYDNLNRLTRITYPDTTFYKYQWNKLDLASMTDRIGRVTQYTYDANRNLIAITDPAGHTTQYTYYPNGLLKTMTDANGGTAYWARDIQSRLTGVTDPKGVITSYVYDGVGNVTTINSPDTGRTQLTYSAANSLIKKIDGRNVESDYSYDWMKRLATITYPASAAENVNLIYDYNFFDNYEIGRLTYLEENDGYTVYARDAVGNITAHAHWLSSTAAETDYQYDKTNRLLKITYPSGRIVTYTRNKLGQITAIDTQDSADAPLQALVRNITYEAFGPLKSLTFGNGVTTTYQRDAEYRPTAITTTSYPQWKYIYSYDAAGNISAKTDAVSSYSASYLYDSLNRLAAENTFLGNSTYQYDANGNRTHFSFNDLPLTQSYASTSNRQYDWSGAPIAMDAGGNITANSGLVTSTYSYNNANRLAQSNDGTAATTYLYDGFGLRTTKQNTKTTHYDYLLDGKYLDSSQLNADGSANQFTDYIWLDDIPIAQIKMSYSASGTPMIKRLTYIHTDHLNTPRAMTDTTRRIVWRWEQDAFGLLYPLNDPDGDRFNNNLDLGFPGQLRDAETSLFYNINRYYDPVMGRYTQPDPIGLLGGLNPYAYVESNPISYFDRFGLDKTRYINTAGGRSLLNGPTNGNWGGKCWSGGTYSCGGNRDGDAPPTDSADACYMAHDKCYEQPSCNSPNKSDSSSAVKACDLELVQCLQKLSSDPEKWTNPPVPTTESDSSRYRKSAIEYFR